MPYNNENICIKGKNPILHVVYNIFILLDFVLFSLIIKNDD